MSKSPRITAYINRAQPFARPILKHLRSVVHSACPRVEERMKWSFPHFDYNGRMMCSMASFKEHAVFGFWHARRMKDPHHVMERRGVRTAMGHFGRITKVSDLPPGKILVAYIKEAAALNEAPPRRRGRTQLKTKSVRTARAPSYFFTALKKNKKAFAAFSAFPPGQKREYIEWITEAKT